MTRHLLICGVIILVAMPLAVFSKDVISGRKFQALEAEPDLYVNRSVVLEGTFQGIDQKFSKIERQNRYTPDMYVKFILAQCPYPCLGMRSSIQDALAKCSRGDLVRVTGDLVQIRQSRTLETIQGSYSLGPSWDERVNLYGPLPSEYLFTVGNVEKGWGRQDSPKDMFSEGSNLKESHYQKVSLADVKADLDKRSERAIWFQGTYEGLDSNFSEKEKEAGLTPDKNLQFSVKGLGIPCFIMKDDKNIEGFKQVVPGTIIQVYGRIRTKETPGGIWGGFFADRVAKVVRRKAPPSTEKEESSPPLSPPPPPN